MLNGAGGRNRSELVEVNHLASETSFFKKRRVAILGILG